jgi:hypothetical protein
LLLHDHPQQGQHRAGRFLGHKRGGIDHMGDIIDDREPRLASEQARNPRLLAAIERS